MTVLEIIAGATLLLTSVLIVLAVMLQSGKGDGLSGAIMGGATGGREKGKESDKKLAKITKVLAVVFFIVTLAVNIVALSSNPSTEDPDKVINDILSSTDAEGTADADAE